MVAEMERKILKEADEVQKCVLPQPERKWGTWHKIELVARRTLQVSRLHSVGSDVVTAAYSQGNTRRSKSSTDHLQF